MSERHQPVLLSEVVDIININHGHYADLTFGEGGHSEALIRAGAVKVTGVDRDKATLEAYRERGFLRSDPRLELVHSRFSEFLASVVPGSFDGILMDLGVSTKQLLTPERGFSFNDCGPLDMRMDQTDLGATLEHRLAETSEEELTQALVDFAEIPSAKRVAGQIIRRFREGRLKSTTDLASLMGPRSHKTHPATQLFMALRMWVNEEIDEIRKALPLAMTALKPHGRLAVITFHSVEDRVVKKQFQWSSGKCLCESEPCYCHPQKIVELITRKPIGPSAEELHQNPRARSAKLRCVEKLPPLN